MTSRTFSLAALTVLELTPPDMVTCAADAGYAMVGLRLIPPTTTEPTYPIIGDTPMVRERSGEARFLMRRGSTYSN